MEEQILLKWTVWPAKKQPARAVFAYAIIGVCVFFAGQTNVILGVGMTIAFALSVGEILLPSQYIVTEDHISVRSVAKVTTKKWTDFTACQPSPNGCLLVGKGSRPFFVKRRSIMVYCFDTQAQLQNILQQKLPFVNHEPTRNQ